MLTKDETSVIDRVLKAVADGMAYVAEHTELSAHQAAAAGGSEVTSLTNRFNITAPVLEALRVRLTESNRGMIATTLKQDVTEEDAKALINAYLEAFPGLREIFLTLPDKPDASNVDLPVAPADPPARQGRRTKTESKAKRTRGK